VVADTECSYGVNVVGARSSGFSAQVRSTSADWHCRTRWYILACQCSSSSSSKIIYWVNFDRRKVQKHYIHSTHPHPFSGPLSGSTRVSRYRKGKTNLDFTEARDSEWQWHQCFESALSMNCFCTFFCILCLRQLHSCPYSPIYRIPMQGVWQFLLLRSCLKALTIILLLLLSEKRNNCNVNYFTLY